jgi:hypothetical protein
MSTPPSDRSLLAPATVHVHQARSGATANDDARTTPRNAYLGKLGNQARSGRPGLEGLDLRYPHGPAETCDQSHDVVNRAWYVRTPERPEPKTEQLLPVPCPSPGRKKSSHEASPGAPTDVQVRGPVSRTAPVGREFTTSPWGRPRGGVPLRRMRGSQLRLMQVKLRSRSGCH